MQSLAKRIKEDDEEIKGELKIQPFFGAQLGSEQDTVQQVARGRIDMGGFSSGSAALILPEITLLTMPFYFHDLAEMDCVLDNHMVKPVSDGFAKKGVQFLGWGSIGAVDLYGKKAYVVPKDLQGAKAAIYATKTQVVFYNAMGASTNALGTPEWIPAFQTGMAEVVFTVISYALPSGFTKVAPVISRNGGIEGPSVTLMNKGVYDKLSREQQAAIARDGERHPASKLRAEIRGFESTLFAMHEKAGGRNAVAPPEQREQWRKAMEPLCPQIVKETGSEAPAFFAAMEAPRKACAK